VATWITDRTYKDVSRVSEISEKGRSGTWSADEQAEWAAGMKGALSYMDYNRIESGIQEIASILNASVSVKTDWDVNGFLTVADASRWLSNIKAIRSLCSGKNDTPETPASLNYLHYTIINQVEEILLDIETIANNHLIYCSEPVCGGEPYYALC
jgi:hypothetical protein